MITVFTPTYNRAHTLPRLYKSLCDQTSKDFEWLIIDDGSKDNTSALVEEWLTDKLITIRYVKVPNGGKQRAINQALDLAEGEYFFIVDSDDLLTNDSLEWIDEKFKSLPQSDKYIGISGIKSDLAGNYLSHVKFTGYVDASNLERPKYGLEADMAEVFYTEKLRKYRFDVWPGETFLPEAVVWNQMALDGYILRWFNHIIYKCEYQVGGLSDSTWPLLKNNPMGYAKLFQLNSKTAVDLKSRLFYRFQSGICCWLAGNYSYFFKSAPLSSIVLYPIVCLWGMRRRKQIAQNA